jgi:hypothetical protein
MFQTLIILYALSCWVTECTPDPGRSFLHSPLSMILSRTLFMTFDIEGLSSSISNNVTFDIEHLRYRHTISKVQNVDIEWTFDIDVFDIECYVQYRRSDKPVLACPAASRFIPLRHSPSALPLKVLPSYHLPIMNKF